MPKLFFLYQSLYVILNVKKGKNKRYLVAHVYSCVKGFNTSDITELLKQYEVWEANAKEYLAVCKEKFCSCRKPAMQSQ